MIITDRFVFLNFPKTGSTFVRDCLRKIHVGRLSPVQRALRIIGVQTGPHFHELLLPNIRSRREWGRRDQHGTWAQIPQEHRHKSVVSVLRNPFDRLVSLYEFRWWQKHPPQIPSFYEKFPQFPDLTFADYVDFSDWQITHEIPNPPDCPCVGLQTIQFIQFFFTDPDRVFAALTDDYIDDGAWRSDMAPVRFLHQENLNRELYDFLCEMAYPPDDIAFILGAPRANVTTNRSDADWRRYYSTKLLAEVRHRERLVCETGGY